MSRITIADPIPGLHISPKFKDMAKSREIYNSLPLQDELPYDVPAFPRPVFLELGEIFIKHGLNDQYGLHLMHGHQKLPPGCVMFRHNITNPTGYWSKPSTMAEVWPITFCGHVFKLMHDNTFFPCEFVEGQLKSDDLTMFLIELAACLRKYHLHDVLGLKMLDDVNGQMLEFDLEENGTLMLRERDTKPGATLRTTGWTFEQDRGMTKINWSTAYRKVPSDTNAVDIGAMLEPDEESLELILQAEGILK